MKVFGKEITPEQLQAFQEGKNVALESTSKAGNTYNAQYHYDKDLNEVIFDKFLDEDQVAKLAAKQERVPAQDRPDYEDWLHNVEMWDTATKVNIHQLNKVGLELDGSQLEEFLTDFEIENDTIDKVASMPNWLSQDGDVTEIKKSILDTINSSAEKVDLFKEKFHDLGQSKGIQQKR